MSFVDDPRQSLVEGLGKVVVELSRGLSNSVWGTTLPSVVAAVDANPELAERYKRLTGERRQAVADLLQVSIDRHELPVAFPVDDFIDALVGPFFYRPLIRQLPTTRPWAPRHLGRTMTAFGLN
jgi:Tetracyclin repressor-like, C-terminal domain